MDIVFNCPKCEQELEVDSTGAGSEIECPSCHETITIPEPESLVPPAAESPVSAAFKLEPHPINPIASSAAAKEEKHLRVPVHDRPTESLIQKPVAPLEAPAAKGERKIRVKTIRHIDCIEVGHDRFDEIVTQFLQKVGEDNVINISSLTYTYLDIGTQKLMTDYAVMVTYRG